MRAMRLILYSVYQYGTVMDNFEKTTLFGLYIRDLAIMTVYPLLN
jgi:hypothetical protein